MTTKTQYISCADTAKLVRAALKAAFPGIKFSVAQGSSRSSLNVRWTDGPTPEQVEKITNQFEGATFDGMQDLETLVRHTVNGVEVSYGAKYIFTERKMSDDFLMKVAAEVYKKYGKKPKLRITQYGAEIINDYINGEISQGFTTADAMYRMARTMSA
jgi:hypothetical protein